MKRLFIHNRLFRLFSPFATGVLVYLLILLINNNVEQIQEQFLSQELYVCIGLGFIIQEFARLSIVIMNRINSTITFIKTTLFQFVFAIILSVFIVTLVMQLYFRFALGYTPNLNELLTFNVLFSFITLLYLLLYTGNQFLYEINTDRLAKEEKASIAVQRDFIAYRSEINSELLFDCLEALLMIMRDDAEQAEELTDKFASLYRYILLKRDEELIQVKTELSMVNVQIEVYNKLPYRKVKLIVTDGESCLLVPMTFLKIVETIIKTSIKSEKKILVINIELKDNDFIKFSYRAEDRLNSDFDQEVIKDLGSRYKFYSDRQITVNYKDGKVFPRDRGCFQFECC